MAVLTVIASATGCRREITIHPYDKAPLDSLQKYEPERKLDDNGRVIELKLENKQLDDEAFDQLGKLTALRTLSLYGSSFTD
ncbi:MAG TPA: hypothetical protein PK867_03000, partial [Pirellulales bacterium]|nr:hypothetical protein [Pirellulales bacterium]